MEIVLGFVLEEWWEWFFFLGVVCWKDIGIICGVFIVSMCWEFGFVSIYFRGDNYRGIVFYILEKFWGLKYMWWD